MGKGAPARVEAPRPDLNSQDAMSAGPTNRKAGWGDGGGLTVKTRQWYRAEGITYVLGLPVADGGRFVGRMRPVLEPRKRGCWRAELKTWSRATEVRTGSWVQCRVGRRCSGTSPRRGPQGRGLLPSAVTATRSCGETDGARVRRSLDCSVVAPAALRADWMVALEEAGGARLPDATTGFRGRLGLSGPFLSLSPGGANRLAHLAARGPAAFPFARRHKMAALGGGATARARGARGRLPWLPSLSRDPRGLVGASARRAWQGVPVPECAWAARVWSFPHQLRCATRPDRVRPLWGSTSDLSSGSNSGRPRTRP